MRAATHDGETELGDHVGSGRPQRESNPGPLHQESRALPTKLSHVGVSSRFLSGHPGVGAGLRETNPFLGGHPYVGLGVKSRGERKATPLFSDDDPEQTRNETVQQTQHQSVEPDVMDGSAPRKSPVSV